MAATALAACLFLALEARARAAAPTGQLVQLAGVAGCANVTASEGCAAVPTVGPGALAIAPDGRNVYMSSELEGHRREFVTTFARDPQSGALSILPGADGCLAETPEQPCASAHGIGHPRDLVLSPDGRFLYVASNDFFLPLGVAIFARDSTTGALTEVSCANSQGADGCETDPALLGVGSLVMSPDGHQLYMYVQNFGATGVPFSETPAILVFDRDGTSGALTRRLGSGYCLAAKPLRGCARAHGPFPGDIVLSPDGRSLVGVGVGGACFGADCFASDGGAVTVFARAADGSLKQLAGSRGCLAWRRHRGCARARHRTLAAGSQAAFSPDGRSVYLAAWDIPEQQYAVVTLARNPRSGTLRELPGRNGCISDRRRRQCTLGRALRRPLQVVVSPDGRSVYVDSHFSDGVAVFARARRNGALRQRAGRGGCVTWTGHNGCERARGLGGVRQLVVSDDGRSVYGLGARLDSSLVAFSRAP